MVTPTQGALFLNRFCDRTFLRLALIGIAVASLGLAACGRKGPLDLPPGASYAGEPQASDPARASSPMISPIGGQAKDDNSGVGPDGKPQAPKGPKKRIPLDAILD
jgi:predicted small lipoprotein YifL